MALAKLTRRQAQTVRLLAQGLTNDEIAQTMMLSPRTIQTYIAQINEMWGTVNRTQATVLAIAEGHVDLDETCRAILENTCRQDYEW